MTRSEALEEIQRICHLEESPMMSITKIQTVLDGMDHEKLYQAGLDIIKEESIKVDVRKYTNTNDWGHSQFERTIVDKILSL